MRLCQIIRRLPFLTAAVGFFFACANRVYFDPAYFSSVPAAQSEADFTREPRLLWSYDLPGEPVGELASFGQILGVGTKTRSVWLVDKVKGKKLGVYDLSGVPAGVIFDGRESFITAEESGNGELISYSLVDGATGWKYPLNEAREMPILKRGGDDPAGTVFAVNRAGKLFALRADDGKLLWSLQLLPVSCVPVWADSAFWLADFEGKLNAVKDGTVQKTVRLPGGALALEAGDGMLFAGCADSTVAAVSTLDGGTLWKLKTRGKVRSLAIAGSTFYFATTSGGVSACRASNGEKLWEKKLEVLVNAPLLALPSIVLVGSAEGRLFALSTQNGEILWERKLPEELVGRPVREGDKIYLASGRKLLAFQF